MSNISKIRTTIDEQIGQLHEAVKEYVKSHMGEKGYIDTQKGCSQGRMYFYSYTDTIGGDMIEGLIKGVRVCGENIQIIGTQNFVSTDIEYSDSDFQEAINKNDADEYASLNGDWENYWQDIEAHDAIFYAPTLLSIADTIENYGE